MNRPGQPPQRPPNLGPVQGLGAPFRGPYPSAAFGLPPRNALQQQGFPGLPSNHRTPGQSMVLPSPNFLQQRGQASYPFGGGVLQQQQQQAQQQQQHPQSQSHQPSQALLGGHSQQQQQTTSSTSASGSLPPHLQAIGGNGNGVGAGSGAPGMGNAQSGSSTSDAALDPNDFPALGSGGSTNTNTNAGTSGGTTAAGSSPVAPLASSYASQAGTGVLPGGSAVGQGATASATGGAATGSSAQSRDFTPDDFPALGGQSTTSQQPSQSQPSQPSVQDASHPPGLNGFEHRQTMQPGMLNIGSQRTLPPNLQQQQVDVEKRATSKLASWNGTTPNVTSQFSSTQQNGTLSHGQQLGAPPGVLPPFQQQQQSIGSNNHNQNISGQPLYNAQSTALVGDGTTAQGNAPAPQTPAQQILMSAADRWGLLGLLAIIKNADADQNLLTVGTDLGTMGLDMQNSGSLFSTFITPWSDSSAAHSVEPDFHLPGCYNVHPPPPGPSKAGAFSEETLFYMFYAHPRDALQEIAAQELHSRNWRYNKELRLWLTKESGHVRHSKSIDNGLGEQGLFTFWDPDVWEKGRKEFTVLYSDLEDKQTPAFVGPSLQPTAAAGQNASVQGQGQPQQPGQSGGAVAQLAQQSQAGRGNFQALGLTAAAL